MVGPRIEMFFSMAATFLLIAGAGLILASLLFAETFGGSVVAGYAKTIGGSLFMFGFLSLALDIMRRYICKKDD